MKKAVICGVAVLALLLAGNTAFTSEKGKNKQAKEANRSAKRTGERKLSEEQKQWRAKLEAMTPEQRRIAIAQRALEIELAPWKQVRQIAAEEKAVKTLAAIDKIIAEKQEQFKKKMAAAEKPKRKGKQQTGQKRKRKTENQ